MLGAKKILGSSLFQPYGANVTLNPSDKGADIVLTSGNVFAHNSNTDTGWDSVRATEGRLFGSWYWETTLSVGNNALFLIVGIGDSGFTLTDFAGNSAISAGVQTSAYYKTGGSLASSGTPPVLANADVVQCAMDVKRGELYLGLNGSWLNSGDPAKRLNPCFTGIAGIVFPAFSVRGTGGGGGTDTVGVNFGATAFSYSIPN